MKVKELLAVCSHDQKLVVRKNDENIELKSGSIDQYLTDELLNSAIEEMQTKDDFLKVWTK